MGTFQIYQCSSCKIKYELGGPKEYRKTFFGGIKEAKHAGSNQKVNGFCQKFWCKKCNDVKKQIVITTRRAIPKYKLWEQFGYNLNLATTTIDYFCKDCKASLLHYIPENSICSKCGSGTIIFLEQITT